MLFFSFAYFTKFIRRLVYLFHDDNICLLSMCCACIDIGGCAYVVYTCMQMDVLVIVNYNL
jgi:hypothetical protein